MTAWFETLDDNLWLRPDEGGEEEANFLSRVLHLRKGQTVLDAPCGAARVSLPLARQGIHVVGVDLRATFIARAKASSQRKGLLADFRVGDLRTMAFPTNVDAAFNWFNSFGYFSDAENADLIGRFAQCLRPGGYLLIDQLNREQILRNFRTIHESAGVVYRSIWDAQKERILLRRIVDGKESQRNRSSQRWYTPGQMQLLMAKAGLKVEAVYGSDRADSYNRGSRQMITVARKI